MHDVAKPETLEAQVKPAAKLFGSSSARRRLFVVLVGIKGFQMLTMISAGKKMVPPPTTVTSAEVKQGDWRNPAIGSISPVQGAMISAELPGTVAESDFSGGTLVKKGDCLLKLDASAEVAQMRSAEADAEWPRMGSRRGLAERKVISAAEFDAAQSNTHRRKRRWII